MNKIKKKDLLRQQLQNCAFPRQTEISLQAIKKKFGKHLHREFIDGDTTPLSFFSFICGKQKCGPFFPRGLAELSELFLNSHGEQM